MTPVESDQEHELRGGNAAELGLASLIFGAVLFLSAPITTVASVLVWRFASTVPTIVLVHAWLARTGVMIGLLVGVAGITFGVRGICRARRAERSSTLAVAGLLLGLAATVAWVIASIGLLNTTETLLRLHGN